MQFSYQGQDNRTEYINSVCNVLADEKNEFMQPEYQRNSYSSRNANCQGQSDKESEKCFSGEIHSDTATLFAGEQTKLSRGSRLYTCPLHPELLRDQPGRCPECDTDCEPFVFAAMKEEEDSERFYMEERFWIGAVVTIPLLLIAMRGYIPGNLLVYLASATSYQWMELAFATPVVLWAGWPLFVRAWQSVVKKRFGIFALTGIVVSVLYIYSLVAVVFPDIYPASFRGGDGTVPVYFETAAVIVLLGLLGMVLQLRRPATPALP